MKLSSCCLFDFSLTRLFVSHYGVCVCLQLLDWPFQLFRWFLGLPYPARVYSQFQCLCWHSCGAFGAAYSCSENVTCVPFLSHIWFLSGFLNSFPLITLSSWWSSSARGGSRRSCLSHCFSFFLLCICHCLLFWRFYVCFCPFCCGWNGRSASRVHRHCQFISTISWLEPLSLFHSSHWFPYHFCHLLCCVLCSYHPYPSCSFCCQW